MLIGAVVALVRLVEGIGGLPREGCVDVLRGDAGPDGDNRKSKGEKCRLRDSEHCVRHNATQIPRGNTLDVRPTASSKRVGGRLGRLA